MKLKSRCQYFFVLGITVFFITSGCSRSGSAQGSGLSFVRVNEPNEGAFSVLMPQGWSMEGGIFRVDPLQNGGPLNSMEAKCNLAFKSDAQGTVEFHILPDIVYAHEGIGAGFWGSGSVYQGAQVRRFEDAKTHLQKIFSELRPQATSVKMSKETRLPGEIQAMDRAMAFTNNLLSQIGLPSGAFQNDAAGGVFDYMENGTHYREILLTGIVNMRAAMTWKNTRTLSFRAPVEEFDQWRPVMDVMRSSVKFNPQWILKEAEGQRDRAAMIQKVFDEMRRIDQEMLMKTMINREEIMNDNFLVLTEQEEYVNPHTNEVEVDTDAFKYRWTTAGGDMYYTNVESEDPNTFLNRRDYKRTPIRKRRNE